MVESVFVLIFSGNGKEELKRSDMVLDSDLVTSKPKILKEDTPLSRSKLSW